MLERSVGIQDSPQAAGNDDDSIRIGTPLLHCGTSNVSWDMQEPDELRRSCGHTTEPGETRPGC